MEGEIPEYAIEAMKYIQNKGWNEILNCIFNKGLKSDFQDSSFKNLKEKQIMETFWLEACDIKHRYGQNLFEYFKQWRQTNNNEDFFYWLDQGEGKEIQLQFCDRNKLEQQRVKYLTQEERQDYLIVVKNGQFYFQKSGQIINFYEITHHSNKNNKTQQNVNEDTDKEEEEEEEEIQNIFVMDKQYNLYIGQEITGNFNHSSFLSGGDILSAGNIFIEKYDDGNIWQIQPHQGHYMSSQDQWEEFINILYQKGIDKEQTNIYLVETILSPTKKVYDKVIKKQVSINLENTNNNKQDQLKNIENQQDEQNNQSQQNSLNLNKQQEFIELSITKGWSEAIHCLQRKDQIEQYLYNPAAFKKNTMKRVGKRICYILKSFWKNQENNKQQKVQKLMDIHWIEATDYKHRYGANLQYYYQYWLGTNTDQHFFFWLDWGQGEQLDLKDSCSREKLETQKVKYLNTQERKQFIVDVREDGLLYYKESGLLVDSRQQIFKGQEEGEDAEKFIFVMDKQQNLYIGPKVRGRLHHSSFLSGGPTIASGNLKVEKGKLIEIKPHSGHYMPQNDDFQTFLEILKDKGVKNDYKIGEIKATKNTQEQKEAKLKAKQEKQKLKQLQNPQNIEINIDYKKKIKQIYQEQEDQEQQPIQKDPNI